MLMSETKAEELSMEGLGARDFFTQARCQLSKKPGHSRKEPCVDEIPTTQFAT